MRWLIYIAIVCIIVLLVFYFRKPSNIIDTFYTVANPLYIKGLNADVVDLDFLGIAYSPRQTDQNPESVTPKQFTLDNPPNYANLCWQRGMRLVKDQSELNNIIQSADSSL